MAEYREPKVTNANGKRSSMAMWVVAIVAILLALLLVAWLMGFFNAPAETTPVVVETPAAEPATPVVPLE